MATLADCLALATRYWETKGHSSRMMPIRAGICVAVLGAEREAVTLSPVDATALLTALHGRNLGKATIGAYYSAFRRMLALSGISTVAWPAKPTVERRVRDPLGDADLEALAGYLRARRWHGTERLLKALRGTGMRVEVEALAGNWALLGDEGQHKGGRLKVTGKGGHERVVPIGPDTVAVLQLGFGRLSYAGHLRRWQEGLAACGITSRLPTPHAVRHHYATKAYARSGKNLRAVQELLGHADIATTARYIGVDQDELRKAAYDD